MANLYRIEKEYKQFILGLRPEEITEYYKQLNKKIIECYPTLNSNWKNEELESLLASVNDVTNILSSTYRKDSLNRTNIASRYLELSDKYLEEIDVATYKILKYKLDIVALLIESKVRNISFFLWNIYHYYTYRSHVGTGIIEEELGIAEEEIEPLRDYFTNYKGSSYYGAKAESSINLFIKMEFKAMEELISTFEEHIIELEFNPEDVPEALLPILTEYKEHYKQALKYIEEFNELKSNPFKEPIEAHVRIIIERSSYLAEEDYSRILENWIASAPKYNFETFELILPTAEVNPTVKD